MSSKSAFVDAKCGSITNMTALSVFTSTSSGVFMLLTVPLNSVVIYCLIKERKEKYKSLFYKLLLNIAIADLLTGLVAEPSTVNVVAKEALRIKPVLYEVFILRVSTFFTDSVALLTLTILSLERMAALIFPIKHHTGMSKRKENILVFSVWPLCAVSVVPYFYVEFVRQLLVFSSVNIAFTVFFLIVTTITYKRKLGSSKFSKEKNTEIKTNNTPACSVEMKPSGEQKSSLELKKPTRKENNTISRGQQKATRTFILMLCVFLMTYLPTIVTVYYINICTECSCVVVHVIRDVSFLFILSSSVFRPLNFIFSLKHLRNSVIGMFRKQPRNQVQTYHSRTTSSDKATTSH